MFKEYSKVMGYIVLTILILSVIFGGLRLVGVFGERVAFENSFQYKKGMESRALTLQAEMAQIEANMLAHPEKSRELQAQLRVLEVQLQATQL